MNKPDIEKVKALIMGAPIGEYIGEEGAEILAQNAHCENDLKDGDFLFHKGELEKCFYIIAHGRLALVKERKNKENRPHILRMLEKGDMVAELCFIDDTPHTASAMALGDVSIYSFKDEDMRPLIIEEPQFMFNFMRAVIKRVHGAISAVGKQQSALSDYIATGGKGRS
jgi:CRP-like cAMP-binding protein